jgi:hypothetical protein
MVRIIPVIYHVRSGIECPLQGFPGEAHRGRIVAVTQHVDDDAVEGATASWVGATMIVLRHDVVMIDHRTLRSSWVHVESVPMTGTDPVLTSAGCLLLKAGTQFHGVIDEALGAEHLTGRQFLVLTFVGGEDQLSQLELSRRRPRRWPSPSASSLRPWERRIANSCGVSCSR